jgi:hypothetical protein
VVREVGDVVLAGESWAARMARMAVGSSWSGVVVDGATWMEVERARRDVKLRRAEEDMVMMFGGWSGEG